VTGTRDRHARRAADQDAQLLHLRQRDAETLYDALKARMGDLSAALRSITWDQGNNDGL
jgi:IS30 family transposase